MFENDEIKVQKSPTYLQCCYGFFLNLLTNASLISGSSISVLGFAYTWMVKNAKSGYICACKGL